MYIQIGEPLNSDPVAYLVLELHLQYPWQPPGVNETLSEMESSSYYEVPLMMLNQQPHEKSFEIELNSASLFLLHWGPSTDRSLPSPFTNFYLVRADRDFSLSWSLLYSRDLCGGHRIFNIYCWMTEWINNHTDMIYGQIEAQRNEVTLPRWLEKFPGRENLSPIGTQVSWLLLRFTSHHIMMYFHIGRPDVIKWLCI